MSYTSKSLMGRGGFGTELLLAETHLPRKGGSYQWALLTAFSVQTPRSDRLRCVGNISVAEILASGPMVIKVAVMIRFSLSLDVYVCEHPVISNNVTL